eukprot:m.447657 g.447657  ORF g.447657 m.447657 type:complete len:692 (-) comp56880_c0_seq8:26-2101(-)
MLPQEMATRDQPPVLGRHQTLTFPPRNSPPAHRANLVASKGDQVGRSPAILVTAPPPSTVPVPSTSLASTVPSPTPAPSTPLPSTRPPTSRFTMPSIEESPAQPPAPASSLNVPTTEVSTTVRAPSPPSSRPVTPQSTEASSRVLFRNKTGRRDTRQSRRSYIPSLQGEARQLASRLFHLEGFTPAEVCKFMILEDEKHHLTLSAYMNLFDFAGMDILAALRMLLKQMNLTGESQQKGRILFAFAQHYHSQQANPLCSADNYHVVATALLMLNSNLHQKDNSLKSSAKKFFAAQLEKTCNGLDFPRKLVKDWFDSVQANELPFDIAQEAARAPPKPPKKVTLASAKDSHLYQLFETEFPLAPLSSRALISRKPIRSSWLEAASPRRWKQFCASLHGPLIILHNVDDAPNYDEEANQDVADGFRIRHAFATRAVDYIKKPNVLRLTLSAGAEFLFHFPNSELVQTWIDAIHLTAALESAPPMPAAATSSRGKFMRPNMPNSNSKRTEQEQLDMFRELARKLARDIAEVKRQQAEGQAAMSSPRRSSAADAGESDSPPDLESQRKYCSDKLAALEYDLQRYTAYIAMLEPRVARLVTAATTAPPAALVPSPTEMASTNARAQTASTASTASTVSTASVALPTVLAATPSRESQLPRQTQSAEPQVQLRPHGGIALDHRRVSMSAFADLEISWV